MAPPALCCAPSSFGEEIELSARRELRSGETQLDAWSRVRGWIGESCGDRLASNVSSVRSGMTLRLLRSRRILSAAGATVVTWAIPASARSKLALAHCVTFPNSLAQAALDTSALLREDLAARQETNEDCEPRMKAR
jgi:hypothetical protein